jgi:riboflavin synthase alpha subunit
MFTGIIEQMGTVTAFDPRMDGARLELATTLAPECGVGASLAVSGVCLTVVAQADGRLAFDVGPETLRATALAELAPGQPVNLERPLRFGGALGGHLVLGHVDGVGTVAEVVRQTSARLRLRLPSAELEPLLVPKGSVAVDGVSLTVAAVGDMTFEVMLIPYTLAATTLGRAVPGRRVNLEMDVIGKYLVRSLSLRGIA